MTITAEDETFAFLLLHIGGKLREDADLHERVAGQMAFWAMQQDPRQPLNWAVSQPAAWKARADRLEAQALGREAQRLLAAS